MERFKHTQRLAAGTQAQDSSKLAHSADPLARVDGVADPVQPKVRGAEIGVGTKDGKTKKTGASVSADGRRSGFEEIPGRYGSVGRTPAA